MSLNKYLLIGIARILRLFPGTSEHVCDSNYLLVLRFMKLREAIYDSISS